MKQLPDTGFVRLRQIIGDKKAGIPALIPVGRSTWWKGVKSGCYPAGVKMSARMTVWRVEEIKALIASI
jgi:prophage regulatory protein